MNSDSVLGLWEQRQVVGVRLLRAPLNVTCSGSKSLSRKGKRAICALSPTSTEVTVQERNIKWIKINFQTVFL